MNTKQAQELLGGHSTEQLRGIIKQLGFLSKGNTPTENKILSAARMLIELRGEK